MSALADSTNKITEHEGQTIQKTTIEAVVTSEPAAVGSTTETKDTEVVSTADVTTEASEVTSTTETENCGTNGTEPAANNETAVVEASPEEETPELTREEKEVKLTESMSSGRRFLITNEYTKAVDVLSSASQLAGDLFGDDAAEAFEPFFFYGQALLEVAKMEDQVINNAISNLTTGDEKANDETIDEEKYGNPEKLTEEERDEIRQQVDDALAGTATETETIAESTETAEEGAIEEAAETEEETTEDGGETEEDAETTTVENEAAEGEVAMETEENAENDDEDDDDSSMKLAWEILELAGRICDKQLEKLEQTAVEDVKTWEIRKSEVLIFLGQHSIADNKYDQAQVDLQKAMEYQLKHLEQNSRIVAQSYHFLAKAFRAADRFKDAAIHYEKAKECLESKLADIRASIQTAVDAAKTQLEEELSEISDLVPELEALIKDANASAEQQDEIKAAMKEDQPVAPNTANQSAEPANDITSQIRRPTKRSASTDPAEDETVKKTKSDEAETVAEATTTTA